MINYFCNYSLIIDYKFILYKAYTKYKSYLIYIKYIKIKDFAIIRRLATK